MACYKSRMRTVRSSVSVFIEGIWTPLRDSTMEKKWQLKNLTEEHREELFWVILPRELWEPHPCRCSRLGWMGPGQPELVGQAAHSRSCSWVDSKVHSNPDQSVILSSPSSRENLDQFRSPLHAPKYLYPIHSGDRDLGAVNMNWRKKIRAQPSPGETENVHHPKELQDAAYKLLQQQWDMEQGQDGGSLVGWSIWAVCFNVDSPRDIQQCPHASVFLPFGRDCKSVLISNWTLLPLVIISYQFLI